MFLPSVCTSFINEVEKLSWPRNEIVALIYDFGCGMQKLICKVKKDNNNSRLVKYLQGNITQKVD